MTATDIRTTAMAAITSRGSAVAKIAQLNRIAADIGLAPLVQNATRRLNDLINRPDPDIATLRAAAVDIVDADATQRANGILLDQVNSLRFELQQADQSYRSDELAPAFDVLRTELDRVTARVAELDAILGTVRSAGDAIAAGSTATDAWAELDALVDDYTTIRDIQFDLVGKDRTASGNPTHIATRVGIYRDSLTHNPALVRRRHASARGAGESSSGAREWNAWLRAVPLSLDEEMRDGEWFATSDHHDELRRHAAHYWVPDSPTIHRADALAHGAMSRIDPAGTLLPELTRDRDDYYNLIEATRPGADTD